jgi:hypothetical protein
LPIRFKNGFCFGEKANVRERLEGAPVDQWVVTQSRVPNRFTVLISTGSDIVAIQVDYFALPGKDGVRFASLEPKSETPGIATSWDELLFKVLKLQENKGLWLGNVQDKPVKYVGREEVAARQGVVKETVDWAAESLDGFGELGET